MEERQTIFDVTWHLFWFVKKSDLFAFISKGLLYQDSDRGVSLATQNGVENNKPK